MLAATVSKGRKIKWVINNLRGKTYLRGKQNFFQTFADWAIIKIILEDSEHK